MSRKAEAMAVAVAGTEMEERNDKIVIAIIKPLTIAQKKIILINVISNSDFYVCLYHDGEGSGGGNGGIMA